MRRALIRLALVSPAALAPLAFGPASAPAFAQAGPNQIFMNQAQPPSQGSSATPRPATPSPGTPPGTPGGPSRNNPVTFTADEVQYDRDAGIVTATGHVEAWQDDRTLRADKILFNRNTGVAAASGNVVLQQADGTVIFSDYAELTQDMKDGVLSGMRALLAENGKLVANGARRTDAKINELTRAVYTTCNLCAKDPTRAPVWDIRAREAVQDTENKRMEYRDAVIDFYGIPVLYTPYLTHPDPSQKRATGLLIPSFGWGSKHLGAYTILPYYVVLDGQSDVTLSPEFTAKADQAMGLEYRRLFNNGKVTVNGSISDEKGNLEGHVFANGQFAINDEFRWGFDINRASSATYTRDYSIADGVQVLGSSLYLEGFGQGSYTRSDVRFYQSLTTTTLTSKLPYVMPRTQYNYVSPLDGWGGRLSIDAGAFNVVRDAGSRTQRASLGVDWSRPFIGPIGDSWKLDFHVDSAAYNAQGMTLLPNFSQVSSASTAQEMPTASLELRWPLQRSAGTWGTQILEPIVKGFLAPKSPDYANGRIPNEDSLDVDFTDATLFSRNRFQGYDRLEGGVRAAVALHAAWNFPGGASVDGLIGQSYRTEKDNNFNALSGLRDTSSDIVSHLSFTPTPYLDVTTRQRFDHRSLKLNFSDVTATVGRGDFRVYGGYLQSNSNPYLFYDNPPADFVNTKRNEASLGGSAKIGAWKFNADVRRDLVLNKFVGYSGGATYEDECFIFDARYYRRFTSLLNDGGDSGVLLTITLKTVGAFGFHPE